MRRSTGGEVPGSSSRPPKKAASRNSDSGTWVAPQRLHQLPYASGSSAVSGVDSSPLTIGARHQGAHGPGATTRDRLAHPHPDRGDGVGRADHATTRVGVVER